MGNCPSYWSVLHFNIKGSETLSLQSFFASLGMQRKNVLVLKSFFSERTNDVLPSHTCGENAASFTSLSRVVPCSKLL